MDQRLLDQIEIHGFPARKFLHPVNTSYQDLSHDWGKWIACYTIPSQRLHKRFKPVGYTGDAVIAVLSHVVSPQGHYYTAHEVYVERKIERTYLYFKDDIPMPVRSKDTVHWDLGEPKPSLPENAETVSEVVICAIPLDILNRYGMMD